MTEIDRRSLIAVLLLLPGALVCACAEEGGPEIELNAIPIQDTSERTFADAVIESTDTLKFMWSRVREARVDDAGNIYVLDAWSQSIVKFDVDGVFVGQLGKKGPGPGEFSDIAMFDVRSDGTVFVSDGGKLTIFDTDGRFVRKGSDAGVIQGVAATDENVVTSSFFGTPVFKAVSDNLDLMFEFGRFQGDTFQNSAKLLGRYDGYSGGFVHLTQFTGILLGFDLGGNQTMAMRTLERPDIEAVGWGGDRGLTGADVSHMLINATDSHVYLMNVNLSEDRIFVDAYLTRTGAYDFTFFLPEFSFADSSQSCGPRYVDEDQIILGCVDGTVLRKRLRFES